MEFGNVKSLNNLDLSLPVDHPETKKLLVEKRVKEPGIFIGCAKWARKDWIGKIYPPKTKDNQFLDLYIKNFNSVELNASFHRIPSESIVQGWSKKAGDANFIFCPKFPRDISLSAGFKDKEQVTSYFLKATSGFEKHLGPYFFQLAPSFSVEKFPDLKAYLETLPKTIALFLEFRHPSWFKKSEEVDEVFAYLKKNKVGVLITDTAGRRDAVHMRLTTPDAFIRFVGYGLHKSDLKRIDDWADRLGEWIDGGLKNIYFFLHNDSETNEVFSPELAAYAIETINKRLGKNLALPYFVSKSTLFNINKTQDEKTS